MADQWPLERDHSLADAEERVGNVLLALGLDASLEALGCQSFSAWRCVLSRDDGVPVDDAEGLGKGRSADEARVGALCEALEHFASGFAFHKPGAIVLQTQGEVATGRLSSDGFVTTLEDTDTSLGCLAFDGIAGGETLFVPAALVCPWYVEERSAGFRAAVGDRTTYEDLWRYSSNSGVALGVGWEEAVLHALHEVIERDSYSLFLLDACVRELDVGALRINRDLLGRPLLDLIDAAETSVRSSIEIYDISTEIGVPAVFAVTRDCDLRMPYRGSGASLSRSHAVARAVTEVVQDHDYDEWAGHEPSDFPARPRFQAAIERCRNLAFTASYRDLQPRAVDGWTAEKATVRSQLAETVSRLKSAGFAPCVRTVARFDGDVWVVQAFVPGLERFMLVTAGHPLAPGRRGQEGGLLAETGQAARRPSASQ